MACRISQAFRKFADTIDSYVKERGSEDEKSIIENIGRNKEFATDFWGLWDEVPKEWKKLTGGRGEKLNSSLKRFPCLTIEDNVRNSIWKWEIKPDMYLNNTLEGVPAPHPSAPLDNLFHSIVKLDGQNTMVEIQWRVSTVLTYGLLDRYKEDNEELATLLLQLNYISPAYREIIGQGVKKWRLAGKKYYDLALSLGGFGALIYLPQIGRSMWEERYSPSSPSSIVTHGLLADAGKKASESYNGLTAHDVANTVLRHMAHQLKEKTLFVVENINTISQNKKPQQTRFRRARNTPRQEEDIGSDNSPAQLDSVLDRLANLKTKGTVPTSADPQSQVGSSHTTGFDGHTPSNAQPDNIESADSTSTSSEPQGSSSVESDSNDSQMEDSVSKYLNDTIQEALQQPNTKRRRTDDTSSNQTSAVLGQSQNLVTTPQGVYYQDGSESLMGLATVASFENPNNVNRNGPSPAQAGNNESRNMNVSADRHGTLSNADGPNPMMQYNSSQFPGLNYQAASANTNRKLASDSYSFNTNVASNGLSCQEPNSSARTAHSDSQLGSVSTQEDVNGDMQMQLIHSSMFLPSNFQRGVEVSDNIIGQSMPSMFFPCISQHGVGTPAPTAPMRHSQQYQYDASVIADNGEYTPPMFIPSNFQHGDDNGQSTPSMFIPHHFQREVDLFGNESDQTIDKFHNLQRGG